MQFKALISFFIITCLIGNLHSQSKCGFSQVLQKQIISNPSLKKNWEELEKKIASFPQEKTDSIYKIPVVFHVVYRTQAQNISNRQILSQLRILNEDYRRLNKDSSITPNGFPVADTQIEFCLAGKDTSGNDFSGVTRTYTSQINIGSKKIFQLQPVWDNEKYLNIYICEIGDETAGYAPLPGGLPSEDAVVIDYTNFGDVGFLSSNYNKGRTTIHEVGHWLGLYHIWGISDSPSCFDDDQVNDTPNQGTVYQQCQKTGFTCGSNDMTTNFMGYVYDHCMAAFTPGQAQRMRNMIRIARPNLLNAIPCSTDPIQAEPDTISEINKLNIYPNPTIEEITISWKGVDVSLFDYKLYSLDGKIIPFQMIVQNGEIEINLSHLHQGMYLLQIQSESYNAVKKVHKINPHKD